MNALVEQARARTLLLEIALRCPVFVHGRDGTGNSSSPLLIDECGVEWERCQDLTLLLASKSQCYRELRLQFATATDIRVHDIDAFMVVLERVGVVR